MRSALLRTLGIALLALTLAGGSGCILDDKVLEVILSNEICAEWMENHGTESWTNTEILDYAKEIDKVLDENGYARMDIKEAKLVSAHWGVTDLPTGPWTVSGEVQVKRNDISDGPVAIISYTSEALGPALNKKLPIALNAAGVALLNNALAQYIAGTHDPILEFMVVNGDVTPDPDATNRIIFDWKAWLLIQVLIEETVENVPDPF